MAKKRDGSVIIYGPMQANTAKQTIGYTDGINHEYTDETKGNKQLNEIIEDYETRIKAIEDGGGTATIVVDSEFKEDSTNPVQSKVIQEALNLKANQTEVTDISNALVGFQASLNNKVSQEYVDNTIKNLETNISQNTSDIKAIEKDYLTSADKTESITSDEILALFGITTTTEGS